MEIQHVVEIVDMTVLPKRPQIKVQEGQDINVGVKMHLVLDDTIQNYNLLLCCQSMPYCRHKNEFQNYAKCKKIQFIFQLTEFVRFFV